MNRCDEYNFLQEEQFYFENQKDLAKIKHYMKSARHFNAIRKMSYEIQDILKDTRGGVYVQGIYPDGNVAYYAFGLE